MKSLKELVEYQSLTGQQDIEVIYDWFVENNKEIEGINLITMLSKSKSEKLETELGRIKGNLSMYSGTDILYKSYRKEIASTLNHIIVIYILGYDIEKDYPMYMNWLKRTIPTLKKPTIFWREFADWLKSKEIYFVDDEENPYGKLIKESEKIFIYSKNDKPLLKFVQTCSFCPEQYDVFDINGKQSGYVRLRHSVLSVDYPDCTEEDENCIYEEYIYEKKDDVGLFLNDEEQYHYLAAIAEMILKEIEKEKSNDNNN